MLCWYKDQWNTIENPDINPRVYAQLNFDRLPEPFNGEEEKSFQQPFVCEQDTQKKNEDGPLTPTYTKLTQNGSSPKHNTIKVLGKYGINLHDLKFHTSFLDNDTKSMNNKRVNKLNFIQIITFVP